MRKRASAMPDSTPTQFTIFTTLVWCRAVHLPNLTCSPRKRGAVKYKPYILEPDVIISVQMVKK